MSNHKAGKSRKGIFITAFAAVAIAAMAVGHVLFASPEQNGAELPPVIRPVKIITLDGAGSHLATALPGNVQSSNKVGLAFRVAGQIESLPVLEGQRVERGQIVARLDATDYNLAAGALDAQLHGARAALTETRLNHGRQRELFKRDMIAKAAYDSSEAALKQASAAVSNLEQQLSRARKNLAYTRLAAPFSGVVTTTLADNFQNIQAGQPILTLQDMSSLEVVVPVPEKNIAAWSVGDTAWATFESLPGERHELKVTEIGSQADAATRTFPVTLALARQPEGASTPLLPGMTAEVTRDGSPLVGDRFTVPASAVFDDGGVQYVWRLDDSMSVNRVAVELGDVTADSVTLAGGLSHGDSIAVAGVHFLREGQHVRPLPVEER